MEKRLGDLRLCWSYLFLNRAMGSVSRRKRIVILLQFTVWNSFIKFLISKTGYEFHKCQAKWIYIKSALNYQNLKIHVPRFATWGWRLASCSPVLGAKASGLRVVMFEWQVYVCMYVMFEWQVDLIYLVLSFSKTVLEHDLAITMWFFSGHHMVAGYSRKFRDSVLYFKAQNSGLGRLVEEDSKLALNWTAVTKKRKMPSLAIQCFHSCHR